MRKHELSLLAPTCFLLLVGARGGVSQQVPLPSPPDLQATVGEDVVVVTRAPIHEAFAMPNITDPAKVPVIKKKPPEPIAELPPEMRPSGEGVVWIPGYWHFDGQENDFIWISGVWRNVPPGRQWLPGYWSDTDGGYRWSQGAWVAGEAITYQPAPPKSQERGPSSEAPSENYFYVPGNWVYGEGNYKWSPGYWAPNQNAWVWVPARYSSARNGYIYSDGYWDYTLEQRGQLFAPVRFQGQRQRQANFRYTPAAVVNTDSQLFLHLFVDTKQGQYLFGDFYDEKYAHAGVRAWFECRDWGRGHDPLFRYYQWVHGGQYLQTLQGWNKYFLLHPEYRPRHTLADQLAFAERQPDFQYLSQTVLGNTLKNVVASTDATAFTRLDSGQLQVIAATTNQIRQMGQERARIENAVSAVARKDGRSSELLPQQVLQLPKLPGLATSQVGPDVPDVPWNLRDAAPVAPEVLQETLEGVEILPELLPDDVPKLPF